MFVYPVTQWLVSPQRKYSRTKGVIFAILFMASVSALHIWYESQESGPNHYRMLNVPRSAGMSYLKKAYRHLSLELHPDKNKAAYAEEEFRKVKAAYDVLSDADLRHVYDRLGTDGVKVAMHHVIDHKYIITQMLVYYASTTILAFLMNFSEATGDSMSVSMFGMLVMLLLETLFKLEKVDLPTWLLPYNTTYDIISTMHRVFPAFMSGSRCIIGSFLVDKKGQRVELLSHLAAASKQVTERASSTAAHHYESVSNYFRSAEVSGSLKSGNGSDVYGPEEGVMQRALASLRSRVDGSVVKGVKERAALVQDARKLQQSMKRANPSWELLRNLGVYLVVYLVFAKTASNMGDKSN
jgi:curved DNA-binding protein CbpA